MAYRPANGEEGRWFMGATCGECQVDHDWHPVEIGPFKWEERDNGEGDGKTCPILERSLLLGEEVDEWSVVDGKPNCTGFQRDEVCTAIHEAYTSGLRAHQRVAGGWESPYPEPDPVTIHPDQLTLL